jgi:hypothetical protein
LIWDPNFFEELLQKFSESSGAGLRLRSLPDSELAIHSVTAGMDMLGATPSKQINQVCRASGSVLHKKISTSAPRLPIKQRAYGLSKAALRVISLPSREICSAGDRAIFLKQPDPRALKQLGDARFSCL